jgi:exopolyphosphatase
MPRQAATAPPSTLAVVDLGSNSFRLELGRVEGDQIFRLDTVRETLRLGAGIDERGRLTSPARRAALACLARFGERLRGLHPSAVRAVATNTFRVAKNAATFLPQAEAALGFPIDIIGGLEEARLIYLGVAHVLPPSSSPRLVIDIGGGSTEIIIGRGLEPERLESLNIGCVGLTQRFFPDGALSAIAFAAAETHARAEIEAIAREFGREHWREAYASSGTALALAELLEQNGLSEGGITREGLARLRKRMIGAGHVRRLKLAGLKPERVPVLAGGFAIMYAALAELEVRRINPVGGALRLGVLYDLLGRTARRDSRAATVERFLDRYHIDRPHAYRVAALAKALYQRAVPTCRSGGAPASGMGGTAARDRVHRLAPGLPQARRLHPAARRHAGFFVAGTASARAAGPRLPRRFVEGRARARQRARARPDRRAKARHPVPSRAPRNRRAPYCVCRRQHAHRRRAGAVAESASADRASAREGARRVGRRRLPLAA